MIEFAGIAFRGLTIADLFSVSTRLAHIVTVNAEYIVRANEDARLGRIIRGGIATFDGQVPYLIARFRNAGRSFDKIPGSELIYHICERAAERDERVFLLGGMPDSNFRAIEVLRRRYCGLQIDGDSPPHAQYPFSLEHNAAIMATVQSFAPHYLLVGFGAVKQDYWIDDHRDALADIGVRTAVGVGGAFEMVSGKLKRAPRLLQQLGLEGVYRLLREPRLFRLKRLLISLKFLRYL